MQRLNLNRVMARYKERTEGKYDVVATLHDMQILNDEVAKVILSFSVESHDRQKNFMAVANLFDGLARPIEGSFRQIPSSRGFAVVGYVEKNTEIRECTTASLEKYRVMAGNILMDEQDSTLWQLKSVNGSKYLARQSEETLSDLVALASVRQYSDSMAVGKVSDMVVASVKNGEFVVYVSPKSHDMKMGYVVSASDESMEILNTDSDEMEEVPNDFLVESTYLKNSEIAADVEVPAQGNKAAMKEYYKQMFSYAPDYYQKMAEIIDENAAL